MLPFITTLAQILLAVLVRARPTDSPESLYQLALEQATAAAQALGFLSGVPEPDPAAGEGHARADDMTTAASVLYDELLATMPDVVRQTAGANAPLVRDLIAAMRATTGFEASPDDLTTTGASDAAGDDPITQREGTSA